MQFAQTLGNLDRYQTPENRTRKAAGADRASSRAPQVITAPDAEFGETVVVPNASQAIIATATTTWAGRRATSAQRPPRTKLGEPFDRIEAFA